MAMPLHGVMQHGRQALQGCLQGCCTSPALCSTQVRGPQPSSQLQDSLTEVVGAQCSEAATQPAMETLRDPHKAASEAAVSACTLRHAGTKSMTATCTLCWSAGLLQTPCTLQFSRCLQHAANRPSPATCCSSATLGNECQALSRG